MTHPITKRHCHYCHNPIAAAFYLPAPIRGWACPSCYFEVAASKQPPKPLMATEGALSELLELAGVA